MLTLKFLPATAATAATSAIAATAPTSLVKKPCSTASSSSSSPASERERESLEYLLICSIAEENSSAEDGESGRADQVLIQFVLQEDRAMYSKMCSPAIYAHTHTHIHTRTHADQIDSPETAVSAFLGAVSGGRSCGEEGGEARLKEWIM